MAYRGYTQAQNKATQKYHKENLDQIVVKCKKGTKDRWKQAAENAGQNLTQFIVSAVEYKIDRLSPVYVPEISSDTEDPITPPTMQL